jgi:hypothetical protein
MAASYFSAQVSTTLPDWPDRMTWKASSNAV